MPLLRLLAVLAVTAVLYPVAAIGNLLLRRRPRRRTAFQARMMRRWSRAVLAVLGVKVTRRGPVPRQPFLLVSNHLSYLDVLALAAEAGARFVAKSEIRGWPLVGRLCRVSGVIFIDRESKRDLLRVAERIEESLADGRGVILFPEATTSRGDAMLPFRPSLLEVAARGGLPVHHVVLSYRTPPSALPAEQAVCWWGDEPFVPHVKRFLRVPWVEARVTFGEEPLSDRDRKSLARRLRQAMEANFVPSA